MRDEGDAGTVGHDIMGQCRKVGTMAVVAILVQIKLDFYILIVRQISFYM